MCAWRAKLCSRMHRSAIAGDVARNFSIRWGLFNTEAGEFLSSIFSAQVALAPLAARPLRVLASRCATRGPERFRVRPSWLRRSFSSRQQRSRVFADPKAHHTLRHLFYYSMACSSNYTGVGNVDLPSTKLHWKFHRNSNFYWKVPLGGHSTCC